MFSGSKIIKPEHVTVDFLTEIMPVNHTVVRAGLLYQHSTVMNNAKQAFQRWERLQQQAEKKAKKDGKNADAVKMPKDVQFDAPQRFHQCCDNKGATIMFVKANHGFIFGGYNPLSWMSDYSYSDTAEAYLFSVTDGKGRKPVRCPVKRSRTNHAIKHNEGKYSPAFGEANISDLFIAFKNL